MTGSREYEQLWTPLVEGQITIPAIHYSFFDPAAGSTALSPEPQTIDVTPGDPGLAAAQPQNPPFWPCRRLRSARWLLCRSNPFRQS